MVRLILERMTPWMVQGWLSMLEVDHASRQDVLGTGYQVDERILEMKVYMSHEKGTNC